MRLSKREVSVLDVLLMEAPSPVYGLDIAKQVYGWWWPLGTIYVHLYRLEGLGLITHIRERVTDGTGRLPRYLYRLTDEGRRMLHSLPPAKDAVLRPG
jgi:DNA-binding PadR family transcriptional regulator